MLKIIKIMEKSELIKKVEELNKASYSDAAISR